MKLLHGFVAKHGLSCVITMGNFDGVHLGHQHLLSVCRQAARSYQCPSMVVTFEPLPREFFSADRAPARLTRLREKLCLLRRHGMDVTWVLPFNARLAGMDAEQFIEHSLRRTKARAVVVGEDFRFGKGRKGDVAMLTEAGKLYGFEVLPQPGQCLDGQRISSTAVRQALANGQLEQARRLLGRNYFMAGRVLEGNRLGRTLGYPTANLALGRRRSPLHGIFAVRVAVGDEPCHRPGVASLGSRPTVDGSGREWLEVHLFNFTGDLYGRHLQVEFCHFLRPEQRFDDLAALTAQMHRDAQQARRLLTA